MEIDERVAFAKEADYQYLKGKHEGIKLALGILNRSCLLYTSPSPRDKRQSRMPSSA